MGIAALLKLKRKDIWALTISCLLGFFVGRLMPDPTWSVFASMLLSYHLFLGWLIFTGEKEVKLSLPVLATIGIHLVFLIIIVALTMAREYIPYFRLVKYALAAVGVFERWLVFNAASHQHGQSKLADQIAGQLDQQIAADTSQPQIAPAPAVQQPAVQPSAAGFPVTMAMTAVTPQAPVAVQVLQPAAVSAPAPRKEFSMAGLLGRKPVQTATPQVNPISTATGEDHEAWLRYLATRNPTHRKAGLSMADEYREWLLARARTRAHEATRQPVSA